MASAGDALAARLKLRRQRRSAIKAAPRKKQAPYRAPFAKDGVASAADVALQKRRAEYGAYELRSYGLAAVAEANCQRRLADLSNKQVREIIERLDRLRPQYPAISDNLLHLLAELQ